MLLGTACRLVALCAFLPLCVAPVFGHAREYRTGPPPGWVQPAPADAERALPLEQISNGTYYLLSDTQVRLDDRDKVTYRRIASRAINSQGVESIANLEIAFDPSYQLLTLHAIDVIRDGRTLHKLADANVRVLQRETALDYRIYDGSRTAHVFLDDVRVGDTVDYAYSVQGGNPVFDHRDHGTFRLQYDEPVRRIRARLLAPAARPIAIAARNAPPEAIDTEQNGERILEWNRTDVAALRGEDNTPGWYDPYPTVQWSEYADWGAVARWAQPLYRVPEKLAPALRAEIDRIARSAGTPAQRLLATLALVQGQIRYLGVEIGPGSHAPTAPALVFERRFGDCKDKALLTVTMLSHLGIDARVALVNTSARRGVRLLQPAPGAFDHAVVEARIDGQRYWLDPTRAPQKGDLAHLYQPDYGDALIVDAATRELTPMQNASTAASRRHVRAVFDARGGFDKAVRYTVTTTAEGEQAETLRSTLATTNFEDLQKQYLNYYARYYPQLTIAAPMEVADEPARNRLTTTEHYDIAAIGAWSEARQRHEVEIATPDIDELLRAPRSSIRQAPLGLKHPLDVTQFTEVLLPETWPIEPDATRVDDPAFTFEHALARTGHPAEVTQFTMTSHFRSLADEVAAADVAGYAANLARAREATGYVLSWTRPGAVPQSRGFDRFNWTVALLGFGMLLLWLRLALALYRYDPPAAATPPDPALQGIGGWLLLPAIGIVIAPIRILIEFSGTLGSYAPDSWAALTTHGSATYHAMWAPVLLIELGMNFALLVLSSLLIVLFFQRRRSVPLLFCTFLAASVGARMLDVLLVAHVPGGASATDPAAWRELGPGVIAAAVWIGYFQLSCRVRSTFIRARGVPAPTRAISTPA